MDTNSPTNPINSSNQEKNVNQKSTLANHEIPKPISANRQGIVMVAIIVFVILIVIGVGVYLFWSRGNQSLSQPQPQPTQTRLTPQPENSEFPSALTKDAFDQSLIVESISFTDSKDKTRKFIVHRKFRDDARREYIDTYLTDENLAISSAIKISRLSDPADGVHPDSGFGTSLFDNTATIDFSPGPGKKFIAVYYRVGDGESFLIIDENGLVNENISQNACDFVKENYNLSGYACFVKFDRWKDANQYYVKLSTTKSLSSGGPTFRVLMDATTGKIIGNVEKI